MPDSRSIHFPRRTHLAVAGSALVAIALVVIWVARMTLGRNAYVSELGAAGEPTALWFEGALLLVAIGGSAIAWAGLNIRSTARLIRRWSPSASVGVAAALFLFTSQVPCTVGCPLPLGDTFTVQDFVHTLAAVLAFAAAAVAMLQASFAVGHRSLRRLSLIAGVSVAVIATAGGVLALLRFGAEVGSVLELIATTIAIGWLIVFAGSIASTPSRLGQPTSRRERLPSARDGPLVAAVHIVNRLDASSFRAGASPIPLLASSYPLALRGEARRPRAERTLELALKFISGRVHRCARP